MTSLKLTAALATLCGLAACGGGSDGAQPAPVDPTEAAQAAWDASNTTFDKLNTGLHNTAFVSVPNSGTANFEGFALVSFQDGSLRSRLIGSSHLTADFAAATVSGTADNFVQGSFDQTTSPSKLIVGHTADGTLALTDGTIGVAGPNDVTMKASGTLGYDGNTVAVSNSLAGKLKGTPVAGLLVDSDTAWQSDTSQPYPIVKLNGTDVNGYVEVGALKK